jgi:Pyridoxamine 5'-phosphate oxidase
MSGGERRGPVWKDQRGSELLQRAECRRLLAAAAGGIAHLGLVVDGHPVVVPVNYTMLDREVLLRLGPGSTLNELGRSPVVALEVDHVPSKGGEAWSVMIQGVATPLNDPAALRRAAASGLTPLVPVPGHEYMQVRTGVLSGRRFPVGLTGEGDGSDVRVPGGRAGAERNGTGARRETWNR